MASSVDYLNYVLEELKNVGSIKYKKMFGEYGLYCDGVYFALICDNRLLIKVTGIGRTIYINYKLDIPYSGGKPMFLIDNFEDKLLLKELIQKTCEELSMKKEKK